MSPTSAACEPHLRRSCCALPPRLAASLGLGKAVPDQLPCTYNGYLCCALRTMASRPIFILFGPTSDLHLVLRFRRLTSPPCAPSTLRAQGLPARGMSMLLFLAQARGTGTVTRHCASWCAFVLRCACMCFTVLLPTACVFRAPRCVLAYTALDSRCWCYGCHAHRARCGLSARCA